jgi:hypothetical protein
VSGLHSAPTEATTIIAHGQQVTLEMDELGKRAAGAGSPDASSEFSKRYAPARAQQQHGDYTRCVFGVESYNIFLRIVSTIYLM